MLFEDGLSQPPTAALAAGYNAEVGAFEFVSDVDQAMNVFFDPGLPRMLVIDTATMLIVYKANGYDEAGILAAADGI